MQSVNNLKSFFPKLDSTEFMNKPWKIVALTIGGVAFLALATYTASLSTISLPIGLALVLGAAGIRYVFSKNCIEQKTIVNKNLKTELIDKIINDLKLAIPAKIDGKLVLFGYRMENNEKDRLTKRYESTANIDKTAVIKEIQASLSDDVEIYNENSKLQAELLIVSTLDLNHFPEKPTVDFQTYKNTYNGLQGNGKLGMQDTEVLDQFLQDLPKEFSIIQVNRSRWNEDGSFKNQ